MYCPHCHKLIYNRNAIEVIKNGRPIKIEFDSYKCYRAFWKDTPKFIPLPEYKG